MSQTPRPTTLLAVLIALGSSIAAQEGGRAIKPSPLDSAVVYAPTISKQTPVRVELFSAENADLGTGAKKNKPKYRMIAQDMKEHAPLFLLESTVDHLREFGFVDVAVLEDGQPLPKECLTIRGEFTKLNPGSQGKRYLVGFGAGKSQICATGRVHDAAGTLLMRFDHCRHEAIGFFGGDSSAQMGRDSMATGSHLADFMAEWAAGKYSG